MFTNAPLRIQSNGEVDLPGVEMGKMVLVKLTKTHIVVKAAGHSYWAQIGKRGYAPARFHVFEIVSGSGDSFRVKSHIDFPASGQQEA